MKKSKIIVPALGLLILSTAASVSGTVAWFTASRTYQADAGDFAVVNTKDNLGVTLRNGLGTTVNDAEKSITVTSGYKLTDASLDHTSGTLIIPDADGTAIDKKVSMASAILGTAASDTNGLFREPNVYSAFTWEMDFALTYGAVSRNVGLFFNANTSAVTAATGSSITDTAKGFRIAFLPKALSSDQMTAYGNAHSDSTSTNAVTRVWADLESGTHNEGTTESPNNKNNCRHIDGAQNVGTTFNTANVVKDYTGSYLMDATYTQTVPSNGAAESTVTGGKGGASANANNYLGNFTFAADTTVHLNFMIVAWFEGTDPNVSNHEDVVYETVKAALHFGVATMAS